MKTALVVGSSGQDGTLLTRQLVAAGVAVVGVARSGVTRTGRAQEALSVQLLELGSVLNLISAVQPDAVFYLAAFHHSSEEKVEPPPPLVLKQSWDVHVHGFANVLEAIAQRAPSARVFFAASSHVFGVPPNDIQNERTPFAPTSLYGITKVAGVELARFYRRRGLHVSTGLLYNHESPLRADKFVSQRIAGGAVEAARAVQRGQPYKLELGNLSAVVDWGWAPDYVDAMRRIVGHEMPDDYVIATGQPHTIADFCRIAFGAVGLDAAQYVNERRERLSREPPKLVGDISRLRSATGWEPSITFAEMVGLLVAAKQQL